MNYYNSIGWDCSVPFEVYDYTKGFEQIPFIWIVLFTHRSVPVLTDEPICCAILVDFKLDNLMKDEPKGENKDILMSYPVSKFWSMHEDNVPVAVLFLKGLRLKTRGYSWPFILPYVQPCWTSNIPNDSYESIRQPFCQVYYVFGVPCKRITIFNAFNRPLRA